MTEAESKVILAHRSCCEGDGTSGTISVRKSSPLYFAPPIVMYRRRMPTRERLWSFDRTLFEA